MTVEFNEQELIDLTACAEERGVDVMALIRQAVLDDLAR